MPIGGLNLEPITFGTETSTDRQRTEIGANLFLKEMSLCVKSVVNGEADCRPTILSPTKSIPNYDTKLATA